MSPILAHAHLAPALRFITLQPFIYVAEDDDRMDELLRAPAVAAEILTRCVELQRLSIVFYRGAEESSKEARRGAERQWKRLAYAPELAPFGQRFHTRVDVGKLQLDSNNKPAPRGGRCCVQ